MTIYGAIKSYYLFALCVALAALNKPAAAMLFFAICSGRAVSHYDLSQSHLIVAYLLLAVVAVFFVDWVSGLVLILVTFAIILGMREILDHVAKVRAGEAILVIGMLFCGLSGPSGGIWSNPHSIGDRRNLVAAYVQKVAVRIGAIPNENRKTD